MVRLVTYPIAALLFLFKSRKPSQPLHLWLTRLSWTFRRAVRLRKRIDRVSETAQSLRMRAQVGWIGIWDWSNLGVLRWGPLWPIRRLGLLVEAFGAECVLSQKVTVSDCLKSQRQECAFLTVVRRRKGRRQRFVFQTTRRWKRETTCDCRLEK